MLRQLTLYMLKPTRRARTTLPIGKMIFSPKVVASTVCCKLFTSVNVLTTCKLSAGIGTLEWETYNEGNQSYQKHDGLATGGKHEGSKLRARIQRDNVDENY